MSTALPLNVHLLTLKALPQDSVLLRLAHLYQVRPIPALCFMTLTASPLMYVFTDQASRGIDHQISVHSAGLQIVMQHQ